MFNRCMLWVAGRRNTCRIALFLALGLGAAVGCSHDHNEHDIGTDETHSQATNLDAEQGRLQRDAATTASTELPSDSAKSKTLTRGNRQEKPPEVTRRTRPRVVQRNVPSPNNRGELPAEFVVDGTDQGYAINLQQIGDAWAKGDIVRVRDYLDRLDPANGYTAVDLRGFEWAYYDHLTRGGSVALHNELPCRRVALSHDGKYLAAADQAYASIWDLEHKTRLFRWRICRDSLLSDEIVEIERYADDSVAFSPDGRYVAATAYRDDTNGRFGAVRVWELETGREQLAVDDDPGVCGRSVVFTPDSKVIVAGSYFGDWKAWNVDDGSSRISTASNWRRDLPESDDQYPSDKRSVDSLRFSEDGKYLTSTCFDGSVAGRKWPDAGSDPLELMRNKLPSARQSGSKAGSKDQPQNPVRTIPVDSTAFSRKNATQMRMRRSDHSNPDVVGIIDGRLWALSELRSPLSMSSLEPRPFHGVPNDVVLDEDVDAACLDWNSHHLVVGGADRKVYAYSYINSSASRSLEFVGHTAAITCVSVSRRGEVASADASGTIYVWSREDRSRIIVEAGHGVPCLKEESDQELVVYSADGSVNGKIPLKTGESLTNATASNTGRFAVVWVRNNNGNGNRCFIWDLERHLAINDWEQVPRRIAFCEDDTRVAVRAGRNMIQVLGTARGRTLHELRLPPRAEIVLSPSGTFLAASGPQRTAVFHVESGMKLIDMSVGAKPAPNSIRAGFAFTQDEEHLIIDGEPVTAWKATSPEQVRGTPEEIRNLVLGGYSPPNRLYRLESEYLEICCGTTLLPLLKVRFLSVNKASRLAAATVAPPRSSEGGATVFELLQIVPVPGAAGFGTCPSLEARLEQIAAGWREDHARQTAASH